MPLLWSGLHVLRSVGARIGRRWRRGGLLRRRTRGGHRKPQQARQSRSVQAPGWSLLFVAHVRRALKATRSVAVNGAVWRQYVNRATVEVPRRARWTAHDLRSKRAHRDRVRVV